MFSNNSSPDSIDTFTWSVIDNYIELDWTGNSLPAESKIFLFRSTELDFVPSLNDTIKTFPPTTTSYIETSGITGGPYYYKIRILHNELFSKATSPILTGFYAVNDTMTINEDTPDTVESIIINDNFSDTFTPTVAMFTAG